MEKIAGIATQVTHGFAQCESGGWHTTSFLLNDQAVRVDTAVRTDISDGERIAVGGTKKDRVFVALAYKNLSTERVGDAGYLQAICIGWVLTVLPLLALLGGGGPIAALLALVGGLLLYRATRIEAAARALEGEA